MSGRFWAGGPVNIGEGGSLRVLVANEPRSYREAMAEALLRLRPGMDVELVEPEDLPEAVARVGPDVVLCSGASQRGLVDVPIWMDLYPAGVGLVVVSFEGLLHTRPDIGFAEILQVLDHAAGSRPDRGTQGGAVGSWCWAGAPGGNRYSGLQNG